MYNLTSKMGIVVFILLKYREARYTVSGTYSRTRFRYTSSFLFNCKVSAVQARRGRGTYSLSIGVVECLQFDDVGMTDDPHDLKFTVLRRHQRPGLCGC